MGPSRAEIVLNPATTTVEVERGRFVRYVGSGRWESYFRSRRGTHLPDGPLLTADVLCRFPPGSYEYERVQRIIAAVDG